MEVGFEADTKAQLKAEKKPRIKAPFSRPREPRRRTGRDAGDEHWAQFSIRHEVQYCDVCESPWDHKSNLTSHVEIHRALLRCPHCPERPPFLLVKPYEVHMKRHEGAKRRANGRFWDCADCSAVFRRPEHLKSHRARVHDGGLEKFLCDDCPAVRPTQEDLVSHVIVHINQRIPCEICGQKYRWRGMKDHVLRSHYEPSFPCPQCSKLFACARSIRAHKTHVHGEKKLRCQPCSYATRSKGHLRRHLASLAHAKCLKDPSSYVKRGVGERKFRCDSCNYAAKTLTTLISHIRLGNHVF